MANENVDVFTLKVFPPADVFPMMSDEELAELAEDIKENGLREPLVTADVDGSRVLIDGRNRRAACKMVGVDAPEVRHLNGQDPTAYVLSANIHRRHMTKGQRAMAVAMIYPNPEKGGRGQKSKVALEFSSMLLSQARTVLALAPDFAPSVLDGTVSLDEAYKTAANRKKARDWRDLAISGLRDRAPDLAQRVVDEELDMDEAKTLLSARDEQNRSIRQSVFSALARIRDVASFAHGEAHRELPSWLEVEEYAAEFKQHFPGGVDELRKYATDLRVGTDEIDGILAKLSKKGARK